MDVGCGTGFGTMVLGKRSKYVLGVDYSSNMIECANRLKQDRSYRQELSQRLSTLWNLEPSSENEIDFIQADLLKLELSAPAFDVITGQRILINLSSHQEQMKVIRHLRRHAADGGLLILVEATAQGHERTDRYRDIFGLPKLEKYWHNNYVDEERYSEWQQFGWKVEHILSFETYMMLSKVIYPAACGKDHCQFLSGANAAAMELASLFRSKSSVEEVGCEPFFNMYVNRVQSYDTSEAKKIRLWLEKHASQLPDWSRLGHQSLLVARAC